MQDISPLALAIIGFICLILIVMNLGLITLFRYKPILKMKPPPVQKSQSVNHIIDVLKDPFGEERKQLTELAGLVKQLDEEKKTNPGKEK